jgi:hypothetical protein
MAGEAPDNPAGLGHPSHHLSNVKFDHDSVAVPVAANIGAELLIAREIGDQIMHYLSLGPEKSELAQLVPVATEIVDNHHLEIPSLIMARAE